VPGFTILGVKLKRVGAALLAACAAALVPGTPAWGNHNTTVVVSTGPTGGNGAVSAQFRGASADGSRVFFQSNEQLVAADTDTRMDIYERSGATTTLLSTGAAGGNGLFNASFAANSADGTRVFFRTSEQLVASDTDAAQDVYERFNGTTTLVSTGPSGGNGAYQVIFDAISEDGTKVFFDTGESLVAGDTDGGWRDTYQRANGTTTLVSTGSLGAGGPFEATYAGKSRDGSRVFFHTVEPLEATDFDTSQDVYARAGGVTAHLSIGPAGGNGNGDFDYDAFFDGASVDGSIAWLHTDEVLVAGDGDIANDVYERSGTGISLLSTGPAGGNADTGAFWVGSNETGSRVFLDTTEPLVAQDTDSSTDIYERSGGIISLLSTGPNGGNAEKFSAFQGASADGSRVFFHTTDSLVAGDTDTMQDVYERAGGVTTLVSQGPESANAPFPATYKGASRDGTKVFFDTSEHLSAATGIYPDIYERTAGTTTFISVGTTGGNGDFFAFFRGLSDDGSRVFFETDESLVAGDTDLAQDVYASSVTTGGYPRPKGAGPLRMSLVPAYDACTVPNREHGPALAFPSCNPPVQSSSQLTVGSPDANGRTANSLGFARLQVVPGNASTTTVDEADVRLRVSITDVRLKSDLNDYAGELQLAPVLRITDRLNGTSPVDTGTTADLPFPVTVPCAVTANTAIGSTCAVDTTADAVVPGVVREVKRTIWQLAALRVMDGGPDGVVATPDNTLFATQGIFIP
jgi:hypothetical protein